MHSFTSQPKEKMCIWFVQTPVDVMFSYVEIHGAPFGENDMEDNISVLFFV